MVFPLQQEIQRLVKVTIQPTDLTNAVAAGNNAIQGVTGLDNAVWDDDDPHFGPLTNIGATWGAFTVLFGWDKDMYLEKAKLMLDAYNQAVKIYKDMPLPDELSNPLQEDQIVVSEYGIHALNEDIPHFLSDY